MKRLVNLMLPIAVIGAIFLATACSGGGGEKVTLSEKGDLLCSIAWKLDPNATLKGTTDAIEDTTGIVANIELKDDVKAFADFIAETVQFYIDKNDKLAYSRTIGEGFLSSKVLGFWEFNADESAVILREWDDQAGAEKAPVTYEIVELTKEKLVLQKEGDASPNIYFPKKK
jgi:hypothetical protein